MLIYFRSLLTKVTVL